ncbi:MAG: carbohydrate porin [Phycisphaerales bacterium]|nr:MAG: carbohydrate porin [Phycisphaerales bacterium]
MKIRTFAMGVALSTTAAALAQSADDGTATASFELNELLDTGPSTLPGQERGPRTTTTEPIETPPREWFGSTPWTHWTRVTGDWNGGRTWLEDNGLTISGSYVVDYASVLDGGIETTGSFRQLIDLNAAWNLEKSLGWKGAKAFVDAQFSFTGGGSADAGDFQGISSLSTGTKNIHQISQLWLQQELLDNRLRLKAGKIDATSEFDFISFAGDFLNSAGINTVNALSSLPTYPNPATGVVAFAYPTEQTYLGIGLFDGATLDGFPTGPRGPATFFSDDDSDSLFYIGEAGLSWDTDAGTGRATIGAWHHTADLPEFSGGTSSGNTGFYALIEQQAWRRGQTDELKDKGLFAFAQGGTSDKEVTAAAVSIAAGLVLKGTFDSRFDDNAGLLIAFAGFSDAAGSPFTDDEIAVEVYYKIQLTPAISLTPDLQYIMNPSGVSTVDDAIVAGLRAAITF